MSDGIQLKPHQIKAIAELHNGSVLRGDVGTGKSLTAVAYYYTKECAGEIRANGRGHWAGMREPKNLYILTTAKKRKEGDWGAELASFGLARGSGDNEAGVEVVVDSWNNILKYAEVKDAFFIFDEQRLVGSGAWVKAFLKIAKANRWILLSATPGDTWMDYIPIFVANGFYKNRTEFLRTHVVFNQFSKFPKVDRYIEVRRLVAYRNQLLVEMPMERSTIRNTRISPVEYDVARYTRVTKDRWHVYEDRPLKNVGEMFVVVRRLINTDPDRLRAIMKLMEKHPRLIVFYSFNYELDMLRTLMNTLGTNYAEWNGQKHQDVPEGQSWVYLVQYTAGSEGWNCITTDAIAFWSLTYSWRIFEQSHGRIDRLNTPYIDLWYYVLRSMAPSDMAIWKSLMTKKDFNEKEFASW